MTAELQLTVRCPQCRGTTTKTLAAIKAQTHFQCECGFHTKLASGFINKPKVKKPVMAMA